MENLNTLRDEVHAIAKSKGFHDQTPETGTMLMLIVSELGEALEADRKGQEANMKGFLSDMSYWEEGEGGYEERFILTFQNDIKDSFEDELADALIRILDLCGKMEIDIESHVRLKMKYNQTRSRKHGKAY